MDRSQKEELVGTMRKVFEGSNLVVVTHYSGLSVGEITDLRNKMREAGAGFKVTKNRITRLALQGTAYENLTDMFTGPTGVAYSADPVAAAKIAVSFAKTNDKLIVMGGAMGANVLDVEAVKSLATLPSLDELRGKLVGMISTPATRIAGVTAAPAGQLARVIGAYSQKGEAA
ncbi:50S ribosomal protein L10 [Varunaivibrio sulfuroxidans]|uniref:Large ribosomal subunit protein uL10 n=1 Tax=Varunaivibrio sulfuroxidans TaxID=1773489 RepID=A0A4R3J5H4_9PROT|nr:50S ribosomal protein L10 [Varunaivibrio sulfuroxidans]TCS60083.1 LSU ribosomal protein L10P [Varunaivibrio sulfuroxidans]WES30474.1 50S ribosomal protein L10 [Varunaivibrio sulfuroxidans]